MEKLTQQKESPRLGATSEGSEQSKSKLNHSNIPKKWGRVLAAFYGGQSFNRFEAERQLNDHCLHSTVSSLQDMGLVIERQFETVPGYRNIPTRVCRYWLHPESKERAGKLLPKSLIHEDDVIVSSRYLWEGIANGAKEPNTSITAISARRVGSLLCRMRCFAAKGSLCYPLTPSSCWLIWRRSIAEITTAIFALRGA